MRALSRRLNDLKARLLAPAARPPRATRLGLESLEAREVPATLTWLGTGTFFSTASNWSPAQTPANGDTVNFSQTPDTTIQQDINNLSLNTINFTNGGNVLTLTTPTSVGGSGNNITNATGNNSITSGTINTTTTLDVSVTGGNLTIGSVIAGANNLRKSGSGTLTLTTQSGNTYTGLTIINDGTLVLNTSTSDSGLGTGSVVTVGDGTGAAGSAVLRLLGTTEIADGSAITVVADGLLDVRSGAFEDFTTLTITNGQLSLPVATGSAPLSVSGGVTLTGAVLNLNSFDPSTAVGTTFRIINNTSANPVSGTFAGLAQGATLTSNGQMFTVSYQGGTGNDVTLTYQGPVPTPPAPAAPFYSGATVVGRSLVLTGAGVAGGTQVLQLPAGSSVLFVDITSAMNPTSGDGKSDVILFVPNLVLIVDGQTGKIIALSADDNGDRSPDLKIFNPDGTTTRTDGRTGVKTTF